MWTILAFLVILFVMYMILCASALQDDPFFEEQKQLEFLREFASRKGKRG